MSVHYKFKAALDYSTVTFDGIHISVSELKKAIVDQKRLGKNADFDLQIINAQTKEVYSDEGSLIPKNTSVIVARVPITDRKTSGPPPMKENAGRGMQHRGFHQQSGAEVAKGSDLSSMDLSEEEKIKAMMTQSTADYDPSHYVRLRGSHQHGRVPEHYRCNKCNQTGHWINKCPNAPPTQTDVKKSTGIPRSFMVVVDSPDVPGAMMTPEGRYAVPAVDHAAYSEKGKPQQPVEQPVKPKIPDDLLCALCKDLLTDALLIPCCANSYCDDCIRSHLVESDHQCPGCGEKDIIPTTLIPNRFLRLTVNAFKSESGYSKPEKVPEKPAKPEKPKDDHRKPSLDELPLDLFPHSPKKVGSESENQETVADPDSTKDLYDFNDGSIPSPFASPKPPEQKQELNPTSTNQIRSLSRPFQPGPPPGAMRGPGYGNQGPNQPAHHLGHRVPPSNYDRHGPPPTQARSNAEVSHEPPPPGFDVPPPGDDGSHRPFPPHNIGGPPVNRPRDNNNQRDAGPPGPQGPDQQMPIPPNGPPPPFNPMHPPPEFHGQPPPHGMPPGQQPPQGPPPGYGHPPPHGPGPHHQNMPPYPNNYNSRLPPYMSRGPPPPMHSGHPRNPMDHHDDFGPRGRGRRPYGPPMHGRMMDDGRRDEEPRPGIIEDPLKEFERIMREKDRRKKMAAPSLRKRSKSRSFSPPLRREAPYPPKRSRSRSFSRSPSPKRKRHFPVPKRRRSYSRSSSRSPPPSMRGPGKSRSRSRNRSVSPGKNRRSPRRAPPQYSPSPPARFPRKEKEDYFDNRGVRERDQDRPSRDRYPAKLYNSREYDGKYENTQPLKNDGQPFHKYDSQRQPSRPFGTHGGHGMQHQHDQQSFNKPAPLMDSSKGHYEFDTNIVPPGTENPLSGPPSLLDMKLQQPPPNTQTMYSISTIGGGGLSHHHHLSQHHGYEHKTEPEHKLRGYSEQLSSSADGGTTGHENKGLENVHVKAVEDDKDRRKKSPVGKKHKKEKKKHKKKNKEEKREKKSKSKVDKSGEVEKSSEEEPETETHREIQKQETENVLSITKDHSSIPEESEKEPKQNTSTAVIGQTSSLSLVDNSNVESSGVVIAKQTAPCDSTVKSPERLFVPNAERFVAESKHKVEPMQVSNDAEHNVPDPIRTISAADDIPQTQEELNLPPSKWDEYEDYISGEPKTITVTERNIKIDGPDGSHISRTERKVTSEVLKKAEYAFFDKSANPLAEPLQPGSPPGLKDKSRSSNNRDKDDPHNSGSTVQHATKSDFKSSVSSAVVRKSAKDRLGSKVSDNEIVYNKVESAISVRSKASPPGGDSSRRRRSRSRSQTQSGRNYRNRSRSKSSDRARSRQSPDRQRRYTQLERESKRSSPSRRISPHSSRSGQRERRSRSKSKREDSSDSKVYREKKRSLSRDRKRLDSRDQKRRTPSRDFKLEREKDRDRGNRRPVSNERRGRSRSGDRHARRKSRSPFRKRSAERKRSASRDKRKRSVSSERYRSGRQRSRSPCRKPAEYNKREEEARGKDVVVSARNSRLNSDEKKGSKATFEDPPSPEASVFQQKGRAEQLFSPSLKKQKGRINIKLSSISKQELQPSGSSSSEDEQNASESKHSDSDDEGKKRAKKRRHSSTSTKSSASDSKKKKKKKDKKKRKKKKKSSK